MRRIKEELDQLYACQDNSCSCITLANSQSVNRFAVLDFIEAVRTRRLKPGQVHTPLWNEYYSRFVKELNTGFGSSPHQYASRSQMAMKQQFKSAVSEFAAAKMAAARDELAPFRKTANWEKVSKSIMRRYNTHYLGAEATSIMAAAQSAENWEVYQSRAFLYPNLKYITAGDERVRDTHRVLDDLVYPVNHPFWDVYMPPNGFRCRCKTVQTDAAPNMQAPDWRPEKGFDHNPGKTLRPFTSDHPYLRTLDSRLVASAENARSLVDLAAVADVVPVGTIGRLAGLEKPLTADPAKMRSLLIAPGNMAATRNELLVGLPFLLADLALIGRDANGILSYSFTWYGSRWTLLVEQATGHIINLVSQ